MEDHGGAVLFDNADDGSGVTEICAHEADLIGDSSEVGVAAAARRPLNTQHLNPASDEILSEVRPILAADTGNEGSPASHPAIVPSREAVTLPTIRRR